jgi:hypothetical protein
MARIPLERTIESTYGFAFKKFFPVLGVLWLPTLVVGVLICGLVYVAWPDFQHLHELVSQTTQTDDENFSQQQFMALLQAMGDVWRFAGLFTLLAIVARAMISVGVIETALGRRTGPSFFYFSLGAPVWRLIGAYILAIVGLIVMGLLVGAAIGLAWVGAEKFAGGVVGLVKAVSGIAAFCWMIYASVRLVFFLPAVVVAEERIGLGRAWQLGGGNFWRIVGLVIAVLLPFAIVSWVVSRALFGGLWMADIQTAVLAGHHLQPKEVVDMILRDLRNIWPILVLYYIVYFTLQTGLSNGAVAAAYKAVTETEASA